MKIASYSHNGTESYGVVVDGGIVDARALGGGHATLRHAIAADALGKIAAGAAGKAPDHRLDEIAFLPPILDPDKIFAIGLNYRIHVEEGARTVFEGGRSDKRL